MPAGAHKIGRPDVDVALPPQSKTTSLRGGYLKECLLFNFDSAKNINPQFEGGNRILKGHPLAKAEGPLLVGFGAGDEAVTQRQARIWGGGRSAIDRPFYLLLNNDQQRPPVVQHAPLQI